jgi:hypothetical protein
MRVVIPDLRTYSIANERVHWRTRVKRAKEQRDATTEALYCADWEPWTILLSSMPWDVTIVRVGPRVLDTDNLAISCKHVRDSFAAFADVDDSRADVIAYSYEQRQGPYAVEIEIKRRAV